MSNLLNQNTQDLKKNGKLKKQQIKLDTDEKNNTNNKNENDRLNMILSAIDRLYQFFETNQQFLNNLINGRKVKI